MFYLIVISVSVLITTAANLAFSLPHTALDAITMLFNVSLSAASAFAIDGILAIIIRRFTPQKWYSNGKKLFKVSKKERDLYNKIKIKRWKDYVPELGGFTSFHKDRLGDMNDEKHLSRFILEANFGMVIHAVNAVLGFLVMLLPFSSSPSIWIPVFAVNLILSILPIFVLRYVSYTLQRLYERTSNNQKHPATH